MATAPSEPIAPRYSLRQTKAQEQRQPQPGSSSGNINNILIHMFQEVPNSFKEAISSPDKDKWLEASKEEFKGLIEMGAWKLVDQPIDHKTIKCRWTYVFKCDGRYKARLVAKGYTQVQGIDYEETFSPVARYESIRYLLAHAALQDWEIEAMDVKLAYLHGVLEEEIYMEQLEGFIAKGEEDKVCKLVRSLYGLKQAGRVWNRTFAHTIKRKLGFDTIHSDAGVYILRHHHKRGDSETDVILILYVDDLLLLGEDLSKIQDIKCQLGKLYQMKDLGPASSYLGIRITRDRNTQNIWINQQAYIENALKRFELLDANSTKTPLPAGIHLEKSEEPVALDTKTYYQQIIGTLIYAAIGTRPNIAFAATRLS